MKSKLAKNNNMQKGFMFDTNIFDAILDGQIDLVSLSRENKYFVTHIQKDEIENIENNDERKNKLLLIFEKLLDDDIPAEFAVYGGSKYGSGVKISTESFALNCSRLGEAKTGKSIYFDALKKGNSKNTEDALIGETAIVNKLVLVTNDKKFMKRIQSLGGNAINFDSFLKS